MNFFDFVQLFLRMFNPHHVAIIRAHGRRLLVEYIFFCILWEASCLRLYQQLVDMEEVQLLSSNLTSVGVDTSDSKTKRSSQKGVSFGNPREPDSPENAPYGQTTPSKKTEAKVSWIFFNHNTIIIYRYSQAPGSAKAKVFYILRWLSFYSKLTFSQELADEEAKRKREILEFQQKFDLPAQELLIEGISHLWSFYPSFFL